MFSRSLLFFLPLVSSLISYSSLVFGQPSSSSYGFHVANHVPNMSNNIGVLTGDNVQYLVEITLGGENFTVILDTGSTDLWVNAVGRNVKLTNTTTVETAEVYAKGQTSGNIAFAELRLGDYVVPSQAFLNATQIADITPGTDGILGMAFDVASIFGTLRMVWGPDAAAQLGRSFITNLFAKNESLPNNFDVQLGRVSEQNEVNEGTFIISDHAPEYESVVQAPKLPRVGSEHWSLVMDEMQVNGQPFAFNKSSVSGVPAGKLIAVLDTGFSLPPLPKEAVDAIYKSIPGAAFWTSPILNSWVIPCNSSVQLSFFFSGQEYPVHPLDLSLPQEIAILDSGAEKNVTVCIGTYQYLEVDPTAFAGFDLILGDAFLRSVYASFDYGDYNPMTNTNGLPFVQMVSTVNTTTAASEFQQARQAALAQMPPTIDPVVFVRAPLAPSVLGPANATTAAPPTDGSAVEGAVASDDAPATATWNSGLGRKWGVVVLGLLAANLLVGVALLAVTLTMCVRGVKGRDRGAARYTPVRFKEAGERDFEGAPLKYND